MWLPVPILVLATWMAPSPPGEGASTAQLLAKAEGRIEAGDFGAAETVLRQALAGSNADTQVLYRLGYVEYRQRKLGPARSHFTEVVRLSPPAYYSRYFLGRIALLENQHTEAIRWLEPIVSDQQTVFDAAAQLATAYAGAGLRGKAIVATQMALASAPWDAPLYYRLGRLYSEAGQKALAAEAFENSRRLRSTTREDIGVLMRAAQLAGEGKMTEAIDAGEVIRSRKQADPNALVALGVIYGVRGLQAEALGLFERATALDPKFFQAQYNRGLALMKLNRASDSAEPLSRAVALLPESVDANRAYGLALIINRQYKEAVDPLNRAWQGNNTDGRVGALLATANLRAGNPARAIELLQSEAVQSMNDPAPLLLLVEALNLTEKPGGALEAAQKAAKRFADAPQAQLALAQQLARMGRYQDAQPVFAAALKLAPGLTEAELGMADTLARGGEHETALPHYLAAARNERTELAARTGLGRSLIALRRFEEAQKVLEEGVALHPSEAALHVELSRAYARLGKRDLAAEHSRIVDRLRSQEPR